MDEVKLIDSSELKETLNMEAALGYIHTLQDWRGSLMHARRLNLKAGRTGNTGNRLNTNQSFTNLRAPINGDPECLK